VSDPAVIGFFGKIPTKGDFVQGGLPRSFVDAWDGWLQDRLASSRQILGESWLDLWMEAPIWRFRIAPGLCGPAAASGLWMPSIDRVGRHFPLVFAALSSGTAWLDAAEAIGLAALEEDLPVEIIIARLRAIQVDPAPEMIKVETIWWTEGAPSVAASTRRFDVMPTREEFAAMLRDEASAPDDA
jgi:type VI secretion system protein ImpM